MLLPSVQKDCPQGSSVSRAALVVISDVQWEDQRTFNVGYFRRMLKEMIQ